jgi:hypothetical protein
MVLGAGTEAVVTVAVVTAVTVTVAVGEIGLSDQSQDS